MDTGRLGYEPHGMEGKKVAQRLTGDLPRRIAVLANWGLGAELLRTLAGLSSLNIRFVVTNYLAGAEDIWRNEVLRESMKSGIPVHHEESLDFRKLRDLLTKESVDLVFCHAYMRIMPEYLFNAPPGGMVNIHPSLLPLYRGASPTWWVLRNRDAVTGLTSHFIDAGVDTGPIIHQVSVPVCESDTQADIIDRLKTVLPELVTETVHRLSDPFFLPITQCDEAATYAPKSREVMP